MDRLDTWTIFAAVAQQSSFANAARKLGRSPAGVHIEIGRLAAAGILIATPSARGTVLTLADSSQMN